MSKFFRLMVAVLGAYLGGMIGQVLIHPSKPTMMFMVLSAQTTPHPCDVSSPNQSSDSRTTLPMAVCWNGLDTSVPPQAVINPVWTLVIDGRTLVTSMTKSGVASLSGQYLYTGSLTLAIGVHSVAIQVASQDGKSAMSVPPIQITVTPPPNQPPVVVAGSNVNAVVGIPLSLTGVITDDGFPLVPSPDGLRVPSATQIVDANLTVWTLAQGAMSTAVLRNGMADNGGFGVKLLWYKNAVYALGTDGFWYQWATISWVKMTTTDPGIQAVPQVPPHITQAWTQTSGPSNATFSNPIAIQTSVTFTSPGIYILRLTGSDGQLNAFSELTVTVSAPPPVPSLSVKTTTTTCNLVITGNMTPDLLPGWNFQGLYGTSKPTSSAGRSTSTPPYTSTVTVYPGAYKVAATWTKKGSATVTTTTLSVTCP